MQQVCDELWQGLAAEGQSEQVAAPALGREQLPANSGLLHCQGQSRQPTPHAHTSAETSGWKWCYFHRSIQLITVQSYKNVSQLLLWIR